MVLWPHQREAMKEYPTSGSRSGTIAIPTGGGKSRVALAIWERLERPRLLVVVPSKDLLLQWRKVILLMDGIQHTDVGLYYTSEKRTRAHIVITTYASLRRNVELLFKDRGMICMDEIHHLEGLVTRNTIIPYLRDNSPDTYILGLSATFKFSGQKKRKMVKEFAPVVYQCSTKKLIDEGFLADPTLIGMPVSFNPNEAAKYSRLQKEFVKNHRLAIKMFGPDMSRWPKGGPPLIGKVYYFMNAKNTLRTMLKRKDEAMLYAIQEENRKRSGALKAMIFTSYIPHLERMEGVLNRNGITAKVVHSKLKWKDRKQRIEDWKNGVFKVLLVAEIGGEGLDVPEANVGVIIGGAKNKEKAIQKMGRILRQVKKGVKSPTIYFIYVPVVEDIWIKTAVSELGRPIRQDNRFDVTGTDTQAVLNGLYGGREVSPPPSPPEQKDRLLPCPGTDMEEYIRRNAPVGRWKVMSEFIGRGKGPLEIVAEISDIIEKKVVIEVKGRYHMRGN